MVDRVLYILFSKLGFFAKGISDCLWTEVCHVTFAHVQSRGCVKHDPPLISGPPHSSVYQAKVPKIWFTD